LGAISACRPGSAERRRIVPREVGRRLQALTVIAGKAMQRLAEPVERQRLDVELDVGRSCSLDDMVKMPSCEAPW
jgi:hypothetical protein